MNENVRKPLAPLYLFFTSITALVVLPKLLETLWLIGAGKALSVWQSGFCCDIGYAAAGVLFCFAFSVNRKPGKAVKDVLLGGLSLLAARLFFSTLHSIGPLRAEPAGSLSAPALTADIVLLVLEALAFAYLLFVWMLMLRDGKDVLGFGKRFSSALKGIREILFCALVYGAVSFGGGFLSDILLTGLGKSRSLTAFFVKLTLLSTIITAAMWPAVVLMRKKADGLLAGGEDGRAVETSGETANQADGPASKEAKGRFLTPERIGVGALLLAVILLDLVPLLFVPGRSGAVLGSLAGGMAESAAYAGKRDYLMALESVDRARALPGAWRAYLEGDPEAAREAYELDRRISMSELLYYYTCAENPTEAEEAEVREGMPDLSVALRSHAGDEVWYFGYLDILSKKEPLTGTERQEKRRVLRELAAGNRFNCAAILPSELTKTERKEILEHVGEYENIAESWADSVAVWELLALYVERNGFDDEISTRTLALAKEYPDSEPVRELVYLEIDECLQTMNGIGRGNRFSRYFANDTVFALIDAAIEDTNSFAKAELAIRAAQRFILNYHADRELISGDRASVREKIYPVIRNFDKLLAKELKGDDSLSEEEKTEARVVGILDMAQVMTDMDMSRELQEYLENARKALSDERIEGMLGAAALKNGDYDTALPILEKEYEADRDDLELTMELAILYVRTGDLTKSLEKAVRFTEDMLAPGVLEEKPQLGTDFTALVATYITGDKSVVDKNMGKHCVYKDFTDEQKEIVGRSELLSKMLDCEYRYQFKLLGYLMETGGDEDYRKLEEDALKLTEDYPLLSTGYYLAGRILGHYAREFRNDDAGRKAQKELIDFDRAIELYEKCLRFEDDQPAVWYSLALTLDHEGRYEEALAACNRVLDHMYRDSWYTDWGQDYHGWGVFGHTQNLASSLKSKLAQAR